MKSFFEGECKQEISNDSVHIFQLFEFFQPIEKNDSKHSWSIIPFDTCITTTIVQETTWMLQIKWRNKVKKFNFASSR